MCRNVRHGGAGDRPCAFTIGAIVERPARWPQRLPTQPVGPRGEFPPVLIGEPQAPSTDLPPQHPILFDQIREHFTFPPV